MRQEGSLTYVPIGVLPFLKSLFILIDLLIMQMHDCVSYIISSTSGKNFSWPQCSVTHAFSQPAWCLQQYKKARCKPHGEHQQIQVSTQFYKSKELQSSESEIHCTGAGTGLLQSHLQHLHCWSSVSMPQNVHFHKFTITLRSFVTSRQKVFCVQSHTNSTVLAFEPLFKKGSWENVYP